MKKSILITAFGSTNWIGGVYYRKNIAFELMQNEYIRENYRVVIFCSKENKAIFMPIKGVKIYTCGSELYKQRIVKALIFLFNRVTCEFPTYRARKKMGVTSISWIPDFQHKFLPEFFDDQEIKRRDDSFCLYADSNMPLVLSSCDSKKAFDKYYHNMKRDVYIVPFVSFIEYEIKRAIENEDSILDKYELSNSVYIVTMNQFWQHKNHIVVFRAIEEYKKRHPDTAIKFVFTGSIEDYRNQEYSNRLRSIANKQWALSTIKILGFIDRIDQIAIMKNALFVIQPSLFEGWGTVVEDAKVLDKTILLSDIPIHREQMSKKCILFDANDHLMLTKLIEEESMKEHVDSIENGVADMYKRAKEYSKGFEQLLRDLEKNT